MAFDMTLVRLRRALEERGGGVNSATIQRRDLKDLLYHFDRLDAQVRTAPPPPLDRKLGCQQCRRHREHRIGLTILCACLAISLAISIIGDLA